MLVDYESKHWTSLAAAADMCATLLRSHNACKTVFFLSFFSEFLAAVFFFYRVPGMSFPASKAIHCLAVLIS